MYRPRFDGLERIRIAAIGLALVAIVGIVRLGAFVREIDRVARDMTLDTGPQATLVYDRTGHQIFSLFAEARVDRALDQLSPFVAPAVLSAEDRYFFRHQGVDFVRVAGAALKNLRSGRVRQGASTITQQLVRAQALGRERTWSRKSREALLAFRMERRFSKTQILQTYLNRIYLGDGYFGFQAASRGYFGKDASDLSLNEAATLAGVIRCPSICSPRSHPDRARARRDVVLRSMQRNGEAEPAAIEAALHTPVVVQERMDEDRLTVRMAAGEGEPVEGMYFVQAVRRALVAKFGEDAVLRGGLRVYTTLDVEMQRQAEHAVAARVDELNAKETKARKGQPNPNAIEASLVALDPRSGDVRALVGGRSFEASPFDRATRAYRQPGSAFKPLFFAAALEQGYAPSSVVSDLDTPIEASNGAWLPSGDHEAESYTLRRALTVSSNRAAARLLQLVGMRNAQDYARRLGISTPLPAVPSLALGTAEVTLLDLTSAYGVFANGGMRVAPTLITRVEGANGEPMWVHQAAPTRAIREETAFLMSTMLADVINRGTGAGVRTAGFRLPAAGKTGTTDSYADAWFVGYTPSLVTGVWVGRDTPAEIMRRGYAATVAVPLWAAFMKAATRNDASQWYQVPASLERVTVCSVTGKRATDSCREAAEFGESSVYDDYFPRGTAPTEQCDAHDEPPYPTGLDGRYDVSPIAVDGVNGVVR